MVVEKNQKPLKKSQKIHVKIATKNKQKVEENSTNNQKPEKPKKVQEKPKNIQKSETSQKELEKSEIIKRESKVKENSKNKQENLKNEPKLQAEQKTKNKNVEVNKINTTKLKTKKPTKLEIALLASGAVMGVTGIALALVGASIQHPELAVLNFPILPSIAQENDNNMYSNLTGLPLTNLAEKNAPTFCIQVPNGTDGARPQAGLNQAGVIFEAIAERGITRFAAIFQNPTSSIIGPIRSLRTYYLEWDTPFDCTITHAGGAADALAAVSRGYRNLDESYQYMYRGTVSLRLWNNLFTTADYLKKFNSDHGYKESNVKGFERMTPEEAKKAQIDQNVREKLDILTPASQNTSEISPKVANFSVNFGNYPSFNIKYSYDLATNSYTRSYAGNTDAKVYNCPEENLGEQNPEAVCELKPLTPTAVVAIKVNERVASDGYHESIQTTGTGPAYIFQNGTVIEGSWQKGSVSEQIKFFDAAGKLVPLVPGQTIVEAIPATYGSVEY